MASTLRGAAASFVFTPPPAPAIWKPEREIDPADVVGPAQTTDGLIERGTEVVHRLGALDSTGEYVKVANVRTLAGYTVVNYRVLDFSSIWCCLESGGYPSFEAFETDVVHVCLNAFAYTGVTEGSVYFSVPKMMLGTLGGALLQRGWVPNFTAVAMLAGYEHAASPLDPRQAAVQLIGLEFLRRVEAADPTKAWQLRDELICPRFDSSTPALKQRLIDGEYASLLRLLNDVSYHYAWVTGYALRQHDAESRRVNLGKLRKALRAHLHAAAAKYTDAAGVAALMPPKLPGIWNSAALSPAHETLRGKLLGVLGALRAVDSSGVCLLPDVKSGPMPCTLLFEYRLCSGWYFNPKTVVEEGGETDPVERFVADFEMLAERCTNRFGAASPRSQAAVVLRRAVRATLKDFNV